MAQFSKATDKVQTAQLTSKIVHALWGRKRAVAGDNVEIEVWTHFVGSGSDIEIKVEDKDAKMVAQLAGKVYGDYFGQSFTVPEDVRESLVFTAKLSKHGLEKKSNVLKVIPPVKVTNMKWGQKEARRGDLVKLSADIQGVPDGIEAWLRILEYDQDGAHDFITKFPSRVKNKRIEAEWEYEYHEDTDEVPTDEEMQRYGKNYNHPEYFFIIDVFDKRFGEKQESGLLRFKDWIEITMLDYDMKPLENHDYEILLPDGSKKNGKLDADGHAIIKDVPPGRIEVRSSSDDTILWNYDGEEA
jgi:hypothetical protein